MEHLGVVVRQYASCFVHRLGSGSGCPCGGHWPGAHGAARTAWRRVSVRLLPADVVLSVLGVLGLAFHCGAMFYRPTILSVPGTETAVAEINALGAVSIVAFVVPAALLIVGLRRISSLGLMLIVLALAAVGTTMYDAGPLAAHLAAIFATVMLLALCAATLIGRPQTGRRVAASAT